MGVGAENPYAVSETVMTAILMIYRRYSTLLVTSRSQEEQEESGLAITGHLSLRWYTVASDSRSRSLVGRHVSVLCIVVDPIYRGKAGGTKPRLDCVRDDELPAEASD